jgi:hypothetical protein
MKKLFLSTALVTLGAIGGTISTSVNTSETLSLAEFVGVYNAVGISLVSTDLYTGDFQSIARSITQPQLYTGAGSSLMVTIRRLRY